MTKREKEAIIAYVKDLMSEVDSVMCDSYHYLTEGDPLKKFIKCIEADEEIFLGKPELIDYIKKGDEGYVVCRCGSKEPTIEDEDSYLTFSFLEQIDDTLYELRHKRVKKIFEETIEKIENL